MAAGKWVLAGLLVIGLESVLHCAHKGHVCLLVHPEHGEQLYGWALHGLAGR